MEIRPEGAELLHADRHTTKLIPAFLSFTNVPKTSVPLVRGAQSFLRT